MKHPYGVVSETTIDCVGKKNITMKTTGHEKCRVYLRLASKADGTKLKQFVVFKGAKKEVKAFRKEFSSEADVMISENAWMIKDLTVQWTNSVLGTIYFGNRLLAWDYYAFHMSGWGLTALIT